MITNLMRDMFWLAEPVSITPPSVFAFGADPVVGTDGVAYDKQGHFQYYAAGPTVGSGLIAFGVILENKNDYSIPYRFKATAQSASSIWGVGFTDSVAGSVTAADPRFIKWGSSIDEMVCVRPRATTPDDYIVFFGIFASPASSVMISGSVQSTLTKPDQYATQVT